MMDFEVDRCARRCAVTGRDFQPGETIYSTLLVDEGRVCRVDYSAEAWPGAPDRSLGWWKSLAPAKETKKAQWAPNDVLLELLDSERAPAEADFRYVVSLLLVRRRVLRLEETIREADGREISVLFCPRNERTYNVPTDAPGSERVREIQKQLAQLLLPSG